MKFMVGVPKAGHELRGRAVVDVERRTFSVGGTGGDLQLGHGRIEELHDLALSIRKPLDAFRRRACVDELIQCRP